MVEAMLFAGVKADIIEDKEFCLRAKIGRIGNTGRFHIGLGLLGNIAGVPAILFFGNRVQDITDHSQGRYGGERV